MGNEIQKISKKKSLTQPDSEWFSVIPSLGISRIDHLFNRLDGAFPHWWNNNFPSEASIDNWAESWAEAFDESAITPEMVKIGLAACRANCERPPSLAEFIKYCRGGSSGRLDHEKAYQEAINGLQARLGGKVGTWSHPAIFWATTKIAFDLRNQTYQAMRTRWANALDAELEIGSWPDVPKPEQVEPALQLAYTREEKGFAAERMRKEIENAGLLKEPDHANKNWAHKIKDRYLKKDKTLPFISVRFANEVLNFLPKTEELME